MDRRKKDELPKMQVGFIDFICMPLYEVLAKFSDDLKPLLIGVQTNKRNWKALADNPNGEYQYIKILRVCLSVRPSVCLSVRSGNGRVFSLKLFILRLQRAARYVRHATVGACRRTSNRQEHKITQRAGPEQDTIFHLHVTACRRRGSHCQDERLAWVASRGQGTSCSSSFVSKVLGAN